MTVSPAVQQTALELAKVDLSYQLPDGEPLHVLRAANLSVSSGELVCVAGRSGSGKSSLLYVAAGLLAPDSGSVKWLGADITTMPKGKATAQRLQTLGFVFQSAGLIDMLTAAENIALPGLSGNGGSTAPGESGARIAQLLDEVGLSERGGHFPAQLSGGERQRVALARALFNDPPLLIVDEPTASLDAVASQQIVDLLRRFRDSGRAVLVASHDDRVIDAADRVVRLD